MNSFVCPDTEINTMACPLGVCIKCVSLYQPHSVAKMSADKN